VRKRIKAKGREKKRGKKGKRKRSKTRLNIAGLRNLYTKKTKLNLNFHYTVTFGLKLLKRQFEL
jgi:hypothetical protein